MNRRSTVCARDHGGSPDRHLHQDRRRGRRPRLGDMPARSRKDHPRVVAYADVRRDSTPSLASLIAHRRICPTSWRQFCAAVQNDLFDVGADLCAPGRRRPAVYRRCGEPPTSTARGLVRRVQRRAAQAHSFILPGGMRARPSCIRPGRSPSGRAHRVELVRGRRRRTNREAMPLPQPALGPAVHPGPDGQPDGDVLWKPGGERARARPAPGRPRRRARWADVVQQQPRPGWRAARSHDRLREHVPDQLGLGAWVRTSRWMALVCPPWPRWTSGSVQTTSTKRTSWSCSAARRRQPVPGRSRRR